MERLRPRPRLVFSGFLKAEVEKMEKMLKESGKPLNKEFYQKIARSFNSSSGRAGKPIVRWTEVQSWFQKSAHCFPAKVVTSTDTSKDEFSLPEASPSNEARQRSQVNKEEKVPDLSELEFEARSSKDGAWYDVDMFISHRFLASGEAEVRVRFVGFGAEEDEWVNVKNAVRERSIPLEHSECHKVQVGDLVCCFQERRDQAIYYDAHVKEIQRRMHDIRGCRCLFLIEYDHDNTEAGASSIEKIVFQTDLLTLPSPDVSRQFRLKKEYIMCTEVERLYPYKQISTWPSIIKSFSIEGFFKSAKPPNAETLAHLMIVNRSSFCIASLRNG